MIAKISQDIIRCHTCPRLIEHCKSTAALKKRAYLNDAYWGKPVPGFGDPQAQLWIVGLAPAAHGANRTGRIFTGDRSGEWLYRALHRAGFANQAQSLHAQDGLRLQDCYISCAVRCAPPGNRPSPQELSHCLPFLEREMRALTQWNTLIALGQFAFHALWKILGEKQARPRMAHGDLLELPHGKRLIFSYHPSQQNTFTGRLTEPMFDRIFQKAKRPQ